MRTVAPIRSASLTSGFSLLGADALARHSAMLQRFDGRPTQASLCTEHEGQHLRPRVAISRVSACLCNCPARQRLRFRRVRRDDERLCPHRRDLAQGGDECAPSAFFRASAAAGAHAAVEPPARRNSSTNRSPKVRAMRSPSYDLLAARSIGAVSGLLKYGRRPTARAAISPVARRREAPDVRAKCQVRPCAPSAEPAPHSDRRANRWRL
jgi:hypothetical protein